MHHDLVCNSHKQLTNLLQQHHLRYGVPHDSCNFHQLVPGHGQEMSLVYLLHPSHQTSTKNAAVTGAAGTIIRGNQLFSQAHGGERGTRGQGQLSHAKFLG